MVVTLGVWHRIERSVSPGTELRLNGSNGKCSGGDLYKHCRHKLKHRKRPVGSVKGIPNRKSIRQRPAQADGSRFGDFEIDTIMGREQSEVMVRITERKTNFIMAVKLPKSRDSGELAKVVIAMLLPYTDKLKTITTDNGTAFAAHELISKRLGCQSTSQTPTHHGKRSD
ncbi:MAG TPA: IS30 family transposase [Smithellaceae bacterium]|nr:IS30 family transposase [Smithellaceae bacterium]